jgi:hypothetical protein
LIFVFQVFEPLIGIAKTDLRDEIPDLFMIGRQIKMEFEAIEERIGDDTDLVCGQNLGIEEMSSRFPHFPDAGGIVVGEIEEKEKFATEKARRLKGRRRDAFFDRLFRGWERENMLFELREIHLLPVISEDEVFFLEIRYGFSLLVQDNDLDELDGDSDFILERLLGPDGFLGS